MAFNKYLKILIVSIIVTSCVPYHPKPLGSCTIFNALERPKAEDLINRAMCFNHPRIPPICLDLNKPLTTQELAVITVLVNPDLKALRAKKGVACAQVFQAGLLPDPSLNFIFDVPLHKDLGLVTAYNLALLWDISGLVIRQSKIDAAKAQYQQTRFDVAWQEWSQANQAQLLATRLYYLQKENKLAEEATLSAKKVLDITRENLEKHEVKIDEFGLRQVSYLDFLDQTMTLKRTQQKTQIQLNQILGIPPAIQIPICIKPLPQPPVLNDCELLNDALNYRLDLIALRAGYASQEAKIYSAVLGQFPHFILGITRARDTTNVNTLGGIVNFDLPILSGNRGVIAVETATRDQLYAEYIARLYQTRTDIATLTRDLCLINQEVRLLNQQLPAMQKADTLMREGLANGNINLITYQNVHINFVTKQLRQIALAQEAAEQVIALQIATGKYLYCE